jgi:hypothetical protein
MKTKIYSQDIEEIHLSSFILKTTNYLDKKNVKIEIDHKIRKSDNVSIADSFSQ